jgi:hypothetical protein
MIMAVGVREMALRSLKGPVPALLALLMLATCLQVPAAADRGGIPLGGAWYREDAQNAIAAWNGREEVLLLSTDLRSERPGRLLEMLPLPSAPSCIMKGDRQQFLTFIELFNQKIELLPGGDNSGQGGLRSPGAAPDNASAVSILFKQSIGAHNLTVARVDDCDGFAGWVRAFADQSGVTEYSVGAELLEGVERQLADGICHFVFDVVETGPEVRSQDPLVYRFNTTRLYYPMEITAASYGNNGGDYPRVNLFLLVDGMIDPKSAEFFAMKRGRGFGERIAFNQSELRSVSADIQSLFEGGALAAHLFTTGGVFEQDRWESFEDVVILKSQVEWSKTPGNEDLWELSSMPDGVRFLTCFSPILLAFIATGAIVLRSGMVGRRR